MPCHAITITPVSGPTCSTCNLMEHRGLNLTTSSPSFRMPSAHIIFVPSPGASTVQMSVCILCNITVARDAQESHLSGKRHARMMRRTRGPRACTCSVPAPVPAPCPEVSAPKISRKRLHIVNERIKRHLHRSPRHKKKRCGQRSYVAGLMKLGRAGLFPQYVRDSEYRVRRLLDFPEPRITANPSPLKKRHSPFQSAALLLDGIHLTEQMLALLRIPGTCISWSNALPYFGRDVGRALGLPPRLALGWPGLQWPQKALTAPWLAIAKDKGQKPMQKTDAQRAGSRKPSVQKVSPQMVSPPKTGAWRAAGAQEARAREAGMRAHAQKAGIQKASSQSSAGMQKPRLQSTGIQKPSSQSAGIKKPSSQSTQAKQKPKQKTKKPPPQKWHCDVCDRTMPLGAKEDHLQGGRHTRKAVKKAEVKTPAPQKQRVGVHGVRNTTSRVAVVAK